MTSLSAVLIDEKNTDARYTWPEVYELRNEGWKYKAEDRHVVLEPLKPNAPTPLEDYLSKPQTSRQLINTFLELASWPDPPDFFHFAPLRRFLETGCLTQLRSPGQLDPRAVVVLDQRYDDIGDSPGSGTAIIKRDYDSEGPGSYLDAAREGKAVEYGEHTVAELFRRLFEKVSRNLAFHAPRI